MNQGRSSRSGMFRGADLPMYNTARGKIDALVLEPPFMFQGVTLYYFPLRANPRTLQVLVDRCLNTLNGREMNRHYFEVSAPLVYMALGDYDKIGPEFTNLGWLDQYELAFLVPLNWYRRQRNGKFAFHATATFSPFLFVDNTVSMANARDVYGWPKCMAGLRSTIDDWFGRPSEDQTLLSMYDRGFIETLQGKPNPYPPLVIVNHEDTSVFSRFPPKLQNAPNPLLIASQWMQLAYDSFSFLFGIPSRRQLLRKHFSGTGDFAANFRPFATFERNYFGFLWDQLVRGAPFVANNINMKQIPSPSDYAASPLVASYKALTNAPISITSFGASGILGLNNLLFGQPNAGYEIGIRREGSGSLVSLLGLKVSSSSSEKFDNHAVDFLQPVTPFWIQADMEYQPGQVLDRNAALPNQTPLTFAQCTGATLQFIRLPIVSRNAVGNVYVLPAKVDVLKNFISQYLSESGPEGLDLKLMGSCVYLITMKNKALRSLDAPTVSIDSTDVYFTVPVTWKENGEVRMSFVVAFAFSTDPSLVSTFVEVLGVPAVLADISSVGSNWISGTKDDPVTQDILRMSTQFLPIYYAGIKDGWNQLLSITHESPLPLSNVKGWQTICNLYGPVIEARYAAVVADSEDPSFDTIYSKFADYMKNGGPLPLLTLKQSRDTEQPEKACLQALVKFNVHFKNLSACDVSELLHVVIRRHATMNIAAVLGLEVKHTILRDQETAQVFQPCRVFSFKGEMEYGSGQIWYERIDGSPWVRNKSVPFPSPKHIRENVAAANAEQSSAGETSSVEHTSFVETTTAITTLREPFSVLGYAINQGLLDAGNSPNANRPAHYVHSESFGNEAVSAAFFSTWERSTDLPLAWKQPPAKNEPNE